MALPNFFRIDQWIKTTQGAAVSGAHVYILSQPTSPIPSSEALGPPAPLATLYTDSTGQTAVPQPLVSDSFGHVEAYMAPNLYTVVVYNNGSLQQVYADQNVAAAGLINGGGLVAGTGISIVGNVISGAYTAGAGITIVNGVISATSTGGVTTLNSLTGALNVTAGTGISVSAAGSSIQITNTLPASVAAGTPIIQLPSTGPGGGSLQTINIGTSNSVVVVIPGRSLLCAPNQWRMTINVNSASVQVVSMNIAQCTQDTGSVVSSTPITFNGGQAAPLLTTGAQVSDTISLTLNPSFDYFVRLRVSSGGLMNEVIQLSGTMPPATNTYTAASDLQSANPIVLSGGTNHAGQSLLISWVAA